ncbi:hypothetical protein J6590_070419 [Homalodisca vitripennis]|nr:hypothetical protein J6590_070419 [Homalodisca vitripennis]
MPGLGTCQHLEARDPCEVLVSIKAWCGTCQHLGTRDPCEVLELVTRVKSWPVPMPGLGTCQCLGAVTLSVSMPGLGTCQHLGARDPCEVLHLGARDPCEVLVSIKAWCGTCQHLGARDPCEVQVSINAWSWHLSASRARDPLKSWSVSMPGLGTFSV